MTMRRGEWGLVPQRSSQERPVRRWEMDDKAAVWIATRHKTAKSRKEATGRPSWEGGEEKREGDRKRDRGRRTSSYFTTFL